MPAQYYAITEQEMHEFLTGLGFQRIPSLPNTVELVYGKRVNQDNLALTLRVYTGINPTGESRECGEDAMRVALFMRLPNGNIVKLGGSKRVHRIAPSASNPEGWRKNLRERIEGWTEYLPKHKCERCGNPMVPRKGSRGEFLGCVTYPLCKNTRSIPQDKPKAK